MRSLAVNAVNNLLPFINNAGKLEITHISTNWVFSTRPVFSALRVFAVYDRSKILATIVGVFSLGPVGINAVRYARNNVRNF